MGFCYIFFHSVETKSQHTCPSALCHSVPAPVLEKPSGPHQSAALHVEPPLFPVLRGPWWGVGGGRVEGARGPWPRVGGADLLAHVCLRLRVQKCLWG